MGARDQNTDEAAASGNAYPSSVTSDADLCHAVVMRAADGVLVAAPDGQLFSANPSALAMLGYDLEELRELRVSDLVHPDDVMGQPPRLDEVRQGKRVTYDRLLKHKDGSGVLVELSASNLPTGHYLATIRDVGERRRAEEDFRTYKRIVESMTDLISVVDRAHCFRTVNDSYVAATGRALDELIGSHVTSVLGEDAYGDAFKELLDRCLAGEVCHRQAWVDFAVIGRRFLSTTFSPCFADSGIVEAVVVTSRDITGTKLVLDALRDSEERMAHALDAAGAGAWEWSRSTGNAIWSPGNYRVMGLDPASSDASYQSWLATVHPDDRSGVERAVQDAIATRTDLDIEFRVVWPDGQVRWINDVGKMRFSDDGEPMGMYGIQRDITARKLAELKRQELEDQLRQSQKMEAIGRLAAGVAHDFNNLLTIIMTNASLGKRVTDPAARDEYLGRVLAASQRAADLTKQLLAFGRRQVARLEPLDLRNIVAEMASLLDRLIGEKIEVVVDSPDEAVRIVADQPQIEQVLLNLAVNGRDAMEDGGKLVLKTSAVELESGMAEPLGLSPGRYALLTVSDTGRGMDDATCARAFEPFFTTKPSGVGTGLGLSTAYGIARQHGGQIIIDTAAGEGTTVSVYLPWVETPRRARPADSRPPLTKRTETVLLVEDQESVRNAARHSLESFGYSVLTAANADEAVSVEGRHDGPIDLLLTDVVLPTRAGTDLARELSEKRPQMQVVYMSGYAGSELPRLAPDTVLIEKPFTPSRLAQVLESVLDKARPAT